MSRTSKMMDMTKAIEEEESDSYEDGSQFSEEESVKGKKEPLKESKIESGFSLRETNQVNVFQGFKQQKHSQSASSAIQKEKLVVSSSGNKKEYGLDKQVLRVSFTVILVRMSAGLKETFQTLGKKVYEEYQKRQMKEKEWKLHGNGYFINFEKGYEVCIINEDMIYEGVTFVTADNVILPDRKGILMDKEGVYEGQFKKGVAHGQGKYTSIANKAEYEGRWEQGIMVDGSIKNQVFKFKGNFVDGVANGTGALVFKQSKSKYVGNFQDGQYHSKNTHAIYQTKDYVYKGQFQHGRKEGKGVLDERIKLKVPKGTKYRPSDQYDGEWMDDYYVTKRKVRELRKLDAEAGHEMIEDMMMYLKDNGSMGGMSSTVKGSEVTQMLQMQKRSQSKIQANPNIPYYQKQQPSVSGQSMRSGKSSVVEPYRERQKSETTPSQIKIPQEFEEDDSEEDSEL